MSDELLSERQTRFVEQARVAVLATVGPDGGPHVAPVWYRYEDGEFLVLTDRGSQKHRNIERDARVELCIDDKTPPYHTVIVRGTATIVEPPPDEAFRLALAVHYLGEERGERYVRENRPDNVLLRITPGKIISW